MSVSPALRRTALLERFPHWEPLTLHAWFDRLCAGFPDRDLVVGDDNVWSYDEVRTRSVDLAYGLAQLGVRPGDRVAMLMANHPDFVPLKLAISRVGGVAAPFNFLYRDSELAYVLGQSRASVLVTMDEYADIDYLAMLDRIAPGWRDGVSEEFPELQHVIVRGSSETDVPGVRGLHGLATLGAAAREGGTLPDVDPCSVSDLIYTSGTTGKPKGVLTTHDGMLRSSFGSALTKALGEGWRALFSLPMYHMFAYTEALLPAMWVGGAVIPRLTFDADDYLRSIERFRATEFLAVPTMTVAILEAAERSAYDLGSLVSIMSAAAAAPSWVWERAKAVLGDPDIVTGWGMTETSAGICLTRPEDSIEIHSTTVGFKKEGGAAADESGVLFHVATVDPATGDRLPDGAVGELVVSSPCVMVGFWEKPEETAAVLQDGWLRTGDLGYVRPDGRVELTGRAKELYKSGGELVMPREVEDFLTSLPGVSQAYAIGLPDELWGERGCAVIVPEADAGLSEEAILDACKQNLARFKVPKSVVFMKPDELPTTPTGKIQKFRLVEMLSK